MKKLKLVNVISSVVYLGFNIGLGITIDHYTTPIIICLIGSAAGAVGMGYYIGRITN